MEKKKKKKKKEIYTESKQGLTATTSDWQGSAVPLPTAQATTHAAQLQLRTASWKGQAFNKYQISSRFLGSTVFERPHATYHKM